MQRATIWLNKSFSSTFNVIEMLRSGPNGEGFRILCSHTSAAFPAYRISDEFTVEPRGLNEADYVAYCLTFARQHAVDVFIPGKHMASMVRARKQFEEANVRLLVAADADILEKLEDKAALLTTIGPDLVPLPETAVVHDLPGFDAACDRLRVRHPTLCFKPAVSTFGLGFRILTEGGSALDRLLRGEPVKISFQEARCILAEKPGFRNLLVMQYLPGPERSVDCLAQDGMLIRCVIRLKSPDLHGGQLIEDNPAVEEAVRRLTTHLRLTGLFNVQFRDCAGVPHLLEINARMSGGLHYATLAGISFPYWAVRLLLGTATPQDVPWPRTGIRVGQVNRAVYL